MDQTEVWSLNRTGEQEGERQKAVFFPKSIGEILTSKQQHTPHNETYFEPCFFQDPYDVWPPGSVIICKDPDPFINKQKTLKNLYFNFL
jgi:hypothetical protein